MGCDIHVWAAKHESYDTWKVIETYGKSKYPEEVYDYENNELTSEVCCDQFYESRDYTLFGLLAEVRADGDNYFTKVRGYGDDWPELLRHYHGPMNKTDFHSATWYNLIELRAFLLHLKGQMKLNDRMVDFKLKYVPDYTPENAEYERNGWEREEYESMQRFYESAIQFLYSAGEERVEDHLEDYRVYMYFDS